ncbi:MAG TPA: hypothetical protein PKC98_18625, partial [Candidatus Melainabacteria bacterium]|nr:hypothetical protein [Candidatus Melainabacteria bacterium]
QFSDANLSYDELQRVKLAFVRVWRTLHHERLKYPSTDTGKMDVDEESECDDASVKEDATTAGDEPCCGPVVLEEEKVEEKAGESDTAWAGRGEGRS